MNILFLAPHLSTGGMPEFLLKRIESILCNYMFNISVIEYNNYSDEYTVQRDKIEEICKVYKFGNLSNDEKILNIKEILKNVDILHIEDNIESFDNIDINVVEYIYKLDRTWKIVETSHNSWFNLNMKRYHPDAYMFCTEHHINYNFNGVKNYKLIEFPVVKKELKLDNNPYKNDKINILSVGLWTPGKNYHNTIKIAESINDDRFQFNIVGNYAPNFKNYWEELLNNLPNNVTVWGEKSNMDDFYSNCDIFLFNSLNECNPISIKEAMSYNKSIVLRNLPIYGDKYKELPKLTDNIDESISNIKNYKSFQFEYNYDSLEIFSKEHIDFYNQVILNEPKYIISFNDGVKCEILGDSNYDFNIKFINNRNDEIIYETSIKSNQWASPNIKYFIDWRIEIFSDDPNFENAIERINLNDKIVSIILDSKSIGDTIAWVSQVEEFSKVNKCKVKLFTFNNNLFSDTDNVQFVESIYNDSYASYKIGCYNNSNLIPILWNEVNLCEVASSILGIEYKEIRPLLSKNIRECPPKNIGSKYVVISTNSTAKMKHWNYENGWNELCDYLISIGFVVINISNDKLEYNNCISLRDYSLEDIIPYIKGSEFLIGLSSGISWLSWALGKKSAIINGFIEDYSDFSENCIKIKNKEVCNSCWNKEVFNKDWNFCPYKIGTNEEYICSKSITTNMIIDSIKVYIDNE